MRALASSVLVLLAACSKGGDKPAPAPGSTPDKPAPGAAAQADGKSSVAGSIEVTGPFAGTFTWKPDDGPLTCGCSETQKDGTADMTMSDEKHQVFMSMTVKLNGDVEIRSAVHPGGLSGTGVKSTCKGEYANSTWHMDLDQDVKGKTDGATGHVKGALDFACY